MKGSGATDDISIHRLPQVLVWAVAVVEALSVTAYDDMARSGIQRLLPDDLQDELFDVRQRTVDLKAAVRSSEREMASLWFIPEPSRQDIFENLRKIVRTTEDALRRVNKGTHQYLSEHVET